MAENAGPLDHADDRTVRTINEFGLRVYYAKGYVVFIEAVHNGRVQQVTVDPDEIHKLIDTLQEAYDYCRPEPVLVADESEPTNG